MIIIRLNFVLKLYRGSATMQREKRKKKIWWNVLQIQSTHRWNYLNRFYFTFCLYSIVCIVNWSKIQSTAMTKKSLLFLLPHFVFFAVAILFLSAYWHSAYIILVFVILILMLCFCYEQFSIYIFFISILLHSKCLRFQFFWECSNNQTINNNNNRQIRKINIKIEKYNKSNNGKTVHVMKWRERTTLARRI